MKLPKQAGQRGFTLTELLITLAVAAVLIGVAIPSFRLYNQNANATALANQLLVDLNTARVEAVKSGGAVRVSAVGGNWTNGWVVATDRDRNGSVNDTDAVIRQANAALSGFTWSAAAESGPAFTTVYFDSRGYLIANQALMFQLRVPDGVPQNCRRVAVALSGRVEVRNGKLNPCS